MRCYDCGIDVGEVDIGDWSTGGTPVGIGMTVCNRCLRKRNEIDEKYIEEIEKADPYINIFGFKMRQSELNDMEDDREY